MRQEEKREFQLAAKNLLQLSILIDQNARAFDGNALSNVEEWVYSGDRVITPGEVKASIQRLEFALEVFKEMAKPPYQKFN